MKKNNRTIIAFAVAAFVVFLSIIGIITYMTVSKKIVPDASISESAVSDDSVSSSASYNEAIIEKARENGRTQTENSNTVITLSTEDSYILYNAYANALSSICEGAIWIDDKSNRVCDYLGYWNYIKASQKDTNNFAVADIDNDGIAELIVEVNNASVADRITVIYQYDIKNDEYYREASFYPGAVFYDNDIVFDEWSHNQGYGDFIWPYSVYKYDKSQDTYNFISQVDSWNRKLKEEGFPEDIDKDGDGNVVMISSSDGVLYLDNADYYEWITDITEGSGQRILNFVPMFAANYVSYATDYVSYKILNSLDNEDTVNDIGVIYAISEDPVESVIADLSEYYELNFTKSKVKEYFKVANDDDGIAFALSAKNKSALIYNNKFSDVTVFGVYPGMKEKQAVAALTDIGFDSNDYGIFRLGSEGWHLTVSIQYENNEVDTITIYWESDYAD